MQNKIPAKFSSYIAFKSYVRTGFATTLTTHGEVYTPNTPTA